MCGVCYKISVYISVVVVSVNKSDTETSEQLATHDSAISRNPELLDSFHTTT
jgi:hypothetical protein